MLVKDRSSLFTMVSKFNDRVTVTTSFVSLGFMPGTDFYGFLAGSDRVMLDTHPYLCFQTLDPVPPAQQALRPCAAWAGRINTTMQNFGMVTAGEWSLGYTDCKCFPVTMIYFWGDDGWMPFFHY